VFVLFKDIDECKASPSVCDVNAKCQNSVGSYRCSCNPGYTGDGEKCSGMADNTLDVRKVVQPKDSLSPGKRL